uniref:F-box domain-containing protein n=1 Tax=Caenorhabditis tropicalis TaxID=1561998 RepID=A0A1I7TKE0_9PELO
MSHSLGIFGQLPVDLLSHVCSHLPINDIVTVSELDSRLSMLVKNVIYKEIKGLRVEIDDEQSNIHFIHKNGRITQMSLDQSDWEEIVKSADCVESLEINLVTKKSTSQLFNCLKNSSFKLRSYKINIVKGNLIPESVLRQRLRSIITQHCYTLRHVNISTPGGHNAVVTANSSATSIDFSYTQPNKIERTPGENSAHHSFGYTSMHEFLKTHQITDVTLKVSSTFDATLALENAYQIALPYSIRNILKRLTVEFGNSLKQASEEEVKELIIQHIRENHCSTRNLQYFHCSLPHDEIDLTQDFIASLNEPVRNHRKDASRPFSSSISLRSVKCQ